MITAGKSHNKLIVSITAKTLFFSGKYIDICLKNKYNTKQQYAKRLEIE